MTTITTLPLFSLCLSGLNVRQTERDADIAALAEDIAARGLKQNLVVIPAHFSTSEEVDNYGDRFEVIAGGRRYQAMKLLAEDGRLPPDHPVPVMVETRDEARETSLSENLHRVAMNPADEFEAFAAIVDQHGGGADAIASCAKRFGVTQRHVEGRLRLASLAPELLEALRAGTIGVESAKAYAGTEDHDLQRKVFKDQIKSSWKPHDPAQVRHALRAITVSLTDPRVKFVGIEAYRSAGGRTEVEMFMGTDGEERVTDVRLLDKMVREAGEARLPKLIKAGGWKDGLFANGLGWSARMPKPPEGMEVHRSWDKDPTKAQKKERIAVFALAHSGEELQMVGHFRPAEAKGEGESYHQETPEERAAAARARRVDLWAARLGVGPFDGTPLKGHAFWPSGAGWIEAIDRYPGRTLGDATAEGDVLVAVQIRVTAEQIAAARAAAEAKVAELEAEEEAARAAREAAAATPDDDDEDGDDEFDESDLEEEDV